MTSQSQSVQPGLECSICLDRFNRPKMLPCQHTYCADCLERLYDGGSVRCPECRVIHPIPADGFQTNIHIERWLTASDISTTINVPGSGGQMALQPTAPPLQLSPSMLPPVYPNPHQQAQVIPPSHVLPFQPVPNITRHGERRTQPTSNSNEAARPTDIGSTSGHENNSDECKTTFLKYFRPIRKGVREMISKFLRKYKPLMAATITYFLVITFTRFIAGAVKLSSDCPKERNVAAYLFVKSIFGFAFWGILLLLGCNKKLMKAMDNQCIEVYVVIESLFTLIWLIIGTTWTIGFRDEMANECPFYVNGWNKHFINFALFLTVVDWIGIVAFTFYCCYIQFDKSNDNET